MVIITWWDAKAMVPSQPTMIIDSENDAVSMPISKAIGVPSETRRRTNCLDQPKPKKPSRYGRIFFLERKTKRNSATITTRERSVATPAPTTPISGMPALP